MKFFKIYERTDIVAPVSRYFILIHVQVSSRASIQTSWTTAVNHFQVPPANSLTTNANELNL